MKFLVVVSLILLLLFVPTSVTAVERDLLRLDVGQLKLTKKHATIIGKKTGDAKSPSRDIKLLNSFFEEDASLWMTRDLASMSLPTEPSSQPPSSPTSSSTHPSVQVPSTAPPDSATDDPVSLPPAAPAVPTPSFTPAPTSSQEPTATAQPSTSPTVTPLPTESASNTPSSIASSEPSLGVAQTAVFACAQPEEVLVLAQPPFAAVTSIPFKVGYLVESSAPLDEYVDQLEVQIMEAAVAGALQCNTGGPIFGINGTGIAIPQTTIPIITLETGALCTPEISECTVLETAFEVLVADDLDSEVAAFLGYIFLREEMDGGSFVSENPTLDRVEYLSPLPLLPPLSEGGVNEIPLQDDLPANDPISVSNWTLGAVIAMSAGGMIAIGAWLRNRHNRNRRHMQLIEEMSIGSPDPSSSQA